MLLLFSKGEVWVVTQGLSLSLSSLMFDDATLSPKFGKPQKIQYSENRHDLSKSNVDQNRPIMMI
jgi:hypothetical protein